MSPLLPEHLWHLWERCAKTGVGSLWAEWLSWRERPLLSGTGPRGSCKGAGFAAARGTKDTQLLWSPAQGYACFLNIPHCTRCSALNMVSQWEGKVCENPDLRPEPMWLLDPTERAGPSWLVVNSVVGPLPPAGQQGPSPQHRLRLQSSPSRRYA